MHKQTQELLQVATRLLLRHENELARLRADTSFVLCIDAGDHSCLQLLKDAGKRWAGLYTEGKVTMPLRTMLMRGLADPGPDLQGGGLAARWRDGLEPGLAVSSVGPQAETAGPFDNTGPAFSHGDHDHVGHPGDPHLETECAPVLQLREAVRRAGRGRGSSIRPDHKPQQSDGGRSAPYFQPTTCCRLLGFRVRPVRGARQPLAKMLEQKFTNATYCDWKAKDSWTGWKDRSPT